REANNVLASAPPNSRETADRRTSAVGGILPTRFIEALFTCRAPTALVCGICRGTLLLTCITALPQRHGSATNPKRGVCFRPCPPYAVAPASPERPAASARLIARAADAPGRRYALADESSVRRAPVSPAKITCQHLLLRDWWQVAGNQRA